MFWIPKNGAKKKKKKEGEKGVKSLDFVFYKNMMESTKLVKFLQVLLCPNPRLKPTLTSTPTPTLPSLNLGIGPGPGRGPNPDVGLERGVTMTLMPTSANHIDLDLIRICRKFILTLTNSHRPGQNLVV